MDNQIFYGIKYWRNKMENRNLNPESQVLSHKNVLITGCSSGIGYASAVFLARQGCYVYATVRRQEDAETLRRLNINTLVPVCPLDLNHLDDVQQVFENVKTDLERRGETGLTALINNAGGGSVAPIELIDLQKFRQELQVRLVGAVAMVQAFLPLIRPAGGRIIWIVTPAAIPTTYVASIHAADFATNCLARTLDIELKPWHIPSIQVRCGGIKTARGLQTTSQVQDILRSPSADLYRDVLSRWGTEMAAFDAQRTEPEEVARVIFKALSDPHPRRRYRVGYMSGFAAMLETLPQPWVDVILKTRG